MRGWLYIELRSCKAVKDCYNAPYLHIIDPYRPRLPIQEMTPALSDISCYPRPVIFLYSICVSRALCLERVSCATSVNGDLGIKDFTRAASAMP